MVSEFSATQSLRVAGFGCIRNGRVLLRQIDFELHSSEILLLKGGNGTGKSTLLRSLAGLMAWRAGVLEWCGQTVLARHADFQQQLAYLGHQCAMNDALSGLENLRFALGLQGVTWSAKGTLQVLEQLGVSDAARRPVGRLSQGQRRRIAIARVMLSQRPLWLLDEPDNALDADGSALIAGILDAHAKAGGMSIVVSHRGLGVPQALQKTLDLSSVSPQQQLVECIAC